MKKFMRTLALTALIAGMASAAHATDGWYGRVDGGYSLDASIEGRGYYYEGEGEYTAQAITGYYGGADVELDDDWMAAAGIGYAHDNGFRTEVEVAYRTNDAEDYANTTVTAWSAMANIFYDFNREGRVQPYLGAGVGYAWVEPEGVDEDSSFAYQGMAGLAFALSERWTMDAAYRYFWVNDLDYQYVNADYEHQAVTLGLRYQFSPPPPPPAPPVPPTPPVAEQPPAPPTPPPPVACPTSDFVVYFAWDRSNLDQAAMDTIDAAVARARQCNMSAATIIGHTDTSGSSAYNVGLSERRASVVRDALVARGVDAALMTTQSRGETDLARATRDGVREPLNRRTAVTITFR